MIITIGLQITRIEGESNLTLEVLSFSEDSEVCLTAPFFEVVRILVVFGCPKNLASFEFKVCIDVEINLVDREDCIFNHLLFLAACGRSWFCGCNFSRCNFCRNFNSRSRFSLGSFLSLDFSNRSRLCLGSFRSRSDSRNNRFCRSRRFNSSSCVSLSGFCLCFYSLCSFLSLDFCFRCLFSYSGFSIILYFSCSSLCCFCGLSGFLSLGISSSGSSLGIFSSLFNLGFCLSLLLCCCGLCLGNSSLSFNSRLFSYSLNIFCTRCCKH